MAAHSPRQPGSSSSSPALGSGPALVPMGHHQGKPGVPLSRPVTVIGSRSTARIHLISSTVSKAHALLVKSDGGMYIRDLASRAHVYVNGEQVREADLGDGDLIKIGSFTFKYVAGRIKRHGTGAPPAPARLDVTGGQFPIPIDQRVMLIGRRGSDDVVLVEDSVSTAHAVIFEMDGERYVRDLGSRTGTFVNGVSTHQHKLAPGDVIRIGETDVKYAAAPADAAALETAGESATGYALEAPQDEIQAAPGDEHGDTIGGLDLMGELVRDEVERDRREDRLQWRRPARADAAPIEAAEEIAPHDEAEVAPKDEVEQAQELEPLAPRAPLAPVDEAPADEATARADEPPALEPLTLADVNDVVKPAAAPREHAAAPSAEIEDLAAELLADDAGADESLSVEQVEAETTARAPASPAEAAPESAPEAAPETLPVPLAEQEAVSPPVPDVEADQQDTPVEAVEADDADIPVRRGWRAALPDEAEPVEPQASKDADHDVLRVSEPTRTDEESRDEVGAGAGAALLDHDALASHDAHADEPAPAEDFDLAESLAAAEPADADASDLKIEFNASAADSQALEPIDLSGIDLGIKDEPPAGAAVSELSLEPPAADEPAPALDFSSKAPPDAPPLIDVEHVAPPPAPLFKLSEDAEALASATEALTKRTRGGAKDAGKKGRGRKKKLSEAVAEEPAPPDAPAALEPIEPFAFEEPPIDIPALEPIDAPIEPLGAIEPPPLAPDPLDESNVEVLDPTQPTPESALALDEADDDLTPGDTIARALADHDEAPALDPLTDTKFAAAVEEFAGDTVGDLVEPSAEDVTEAREPRVEEREETRRQPPHEARRDDADLIVPRAQDKPRAPAFDPTTVGANRENFLGGVPLPRVPLPRVPPHEPEPVAAGPDPVDDLIAEIDTAAAAAERARVESTAPPAADEAQRAAAEDDLSAAPFVPIPPAVPRMPRRPRPIVKRGVELAPLPAHVDESIPPFKGSDATGGSVTSAFDGLAMPPVRQADVFSQMSPPALDDASARQHPPQRGEDPREASGIMTPMDLVGLRREPPPAPGAGAAGGRRARPTPVPGAYKVPDDFFGPGGAIDKGAPEPITPPGFPSPTRAPAPPSSSSLLDREEASREAAVAEDDGGIPSPRRRVRPALPDPQARAAERRPPVIYSEDDLEIDAAAQRRKYVRRAQVLTVVGLLLVVAAALGTYMFVPVRSLVEANITYKNLAERTKRDRDEIHQDQLKRLNMDHVRRGAMKNVLQTPEVDPGFLEDTETYARVVQNAGWRETGNVWTLAIPYEGTQREQDRVRMKALATALWQDNEATLGRHHRDVRSQVERLKDTIKTNEKRAQDLAGEIASLRILYEKRPAGEQVKSLEGNVAKSEDAWKKAVAAVKEAEAELTRLKQGGAQPAASAAAPAAPVEPKDDELAQMQRELRDLQAKADENRNQSSEEARKAREQLAESIESLNQEITSANATFPGSPEMTAYIESAQKLFETTREVVAEMVRRQEQQFNSIMELKARLNEKMEARRSEQWRADKELQDLTERLAILTRQYNAAVGGGLKNEAGELKAQVELTQSMVKARQELIPVDPGYAEAIAQIEQFIDTTKKNIAEDRTRTDDLLARLQKSFTSGPQIAKLPADQQELARRLGEKLTAINAARQQYNQSLDVGAERATDESLQQQIATLTAGIDARKKQLLDQRGAGGAAASAEALKQKQAELDRLKAEQSKAEEAYFAASKELENARRAVADARNSFEKLERLEAERNTVQTSLKTQNDTLLDKQRELKEAVYPEPPADSDIRVRDLGDRRVIYAAGAGGALFLLFAGLVTMSSLQAVRLGPGGAARALAPTDLQPIQHPRPQPSAHGNGNGAAADTNGDAPSPAHHIADDDDREPAII